MFVVAGGALGLAAIAVALIVVLGGGSSSPPGGSNSASTYRAKLTSALAPVLTANSALSTSLQSLSGKNTGAARAALTQAQSAVTAAHGAVSVLTVPASASQLSQQAEQALTHESGYLQGVGAVLSGPTSANSAQLPTLATAAQSALVTLGGVAPNGSQSISGTSGLTTWAAAQASTPAPAHHHAPPAATATTTVTSTTTSGGGGPYSSGTSCGGGLYAGPDTSCPFAENVQTAYFQAGGSGAETVGAYSPVTNQEYTMSCSPTGDGVTCTGGNNASVSW